MKAIDLFKQHLGEELKAIEALGLYKQEGLITSPQNAHVKIASGKELLNLCANNYLGLSDHPEVTEAAKFHGYGMASVRFICGAQDIHRQLENKISESFGTEDTILYASCFDANAGLFDTP